MPIRRRAANGRQSRISMAKAILLDDNNDILVINGSMVVGESEMQEVAVILGMQQGEQKFDPVLGPNLTQLLKTNANKFDIQQRARVHLGRDGKEYDSIKNKLMIDKNV